MPKPPKISVSSSASATPWIDCKRIGIGASFFASTEKRSIETTSSVNVSGAKSCCSVVVWPPKSRISALEEGDLRPDQVKLIAKRLGVTEQDVVDMNRRLGGDASLNAPIREDGDSGEWQDWLADDSASQESVLAAHEESDNRRQLYWSFGR